MRVLELFAGAGGAALGLERAGLEHAALVERDPDACATLRAAGLGPVVEGDVRDLDAIEAVAGPSVDVLWASPPCQPWSENGSRRGANDERNMWPATFDAIERFRPRWVICEAVPGMVVHQLDCDMEGGRPHECRGCYSQVEILAPLADMFAQLSILELNAADYGVPQARRRVFIVAGPEPLPEPKATVAARTTVADIVDPWACPTCSGSGRLAAGMFGSVPCSACNGTGAFPAFVGHPVSIVATGRAGGGTARSVDRPAPTIGTKGTAMFVRVPAGEKMTATTPGRRLTAAEEAALMGFPRGYPFCGADGVKRRQAGNAVPPRLAEVVAMQVPQ